MSKKLRRGTFDRKIFGVCRGIANFYNLEVTLIRALFFLSILFGGTGIALYFILALVIPKDDYIEYK